MVTYCYLISNLNPVAAVFFDTRYNSQGMNKVISRIEINGTRITQPVQMKHTGRINEYWSLLIPLDACSNI